MAALFILFPAGSAGRYLSVYFGGIFGETASWDVSDNTTKIRAGEEYE